MTKQIVLMKTTDGDMEIELYPEIAPKTVENFVKLVKEGFYTDILFHRVIAGFVIQGGDPAGTGMGGSKETIVGEFNSNGHKNDLKHTKGVISMARTMAPNSASSQFFICHADVGALDNNYAGFGKVIKGLEVVDSIAAVGTDHNDRPTVEKKIISAEMK